MAKLKLLERTREQASIHTCMSHERIVDEILTLVHPPVSEASWGRVESKGVSPEIMRRILDAFEIHARNVGGTPAIVQSHVVPAYEDLEQSSAISLSPSSGIDEYNRLAMIPYRRNDFFTGRTHVLQDLYDAAKAESPSIVVVTGLGGLGKTQLVVEFAHKYSTEFAAILWADARDALQLSESYRAIAEHLNLPEASDFDAQTSVRAVKRWLGGNPGWLLILDNADDLTVLDPYPQAPGVLNRVRNMCYAVHSVSQALELRPVLRMPGG